MCPETLSGISDITLRSPNLTAHNHPEPMPVASSSRTRIPRINTSEPYTRRFTQGDILLLRRLQGEERLVTLNTLRKVALALDPERTIFSTLR